MITKEQSEILSKYLGISFKFESHQTTTKALFSIDNSSYIMYEEDTKNFDFLLFYKKTSFTFSTKSLNLKTIQQAMKDYTEKAYCNALNQAAHRKQIYKQLKHSISEL